MHPVLVIAGPTASGKSALALAAAREFDGVVINADSMQVYRELRILTARPSAEEEAAVPHRLYGFLSAAERCSAGRWAALAAEEVRAAWAAKRLAILVGGTGFYLKALIEGLNEIPEVSAEVRAETIALRSELGADAFHSALAKVDPAAAARIAPADAQRTTRAYEVWLATGRSLSDWQAEPAVSPLPDARFEIVVLDPPRDALNAACDARLEGMMAAGALDEVRALAALKLDPGLPAMKALAVPELLDHLSGRPTLEAAVDAAKRATRQFARRQRTWFRTQIGTGLRLDAQFSESLLPEFFTKIRESLLTAQN